MRTIYTDGSCLGNPWPGGRATILQHTTQEDIHEDEIVLTGGISETTNNVMELTAAIQALQWLWEKYSGETWIWSEEQAQDWFFAAPSVVASLRCDELIVLTTDSSYVKLGITEWMVTWKRRQWRRAKGGKLVENVSLRKQLDMLAQCFPQLRRERTKAHVGTELNERVDQLAREQAMRYG